MGVTSYLTVNGEILSETRSGVESDYIPDPQGSTVALVDSSQTITDTFTWWPYGEVRSHVGSSVTPFGYNGTLGYYADGASGRLYVRANILLPSQTHWLTQDRLWPSELPYVYTSSAPTNFTDPSGLCRTRGASPLPPNPTNCRIYQIQCGEGFVYACNAFYACLNTGSSPEGNCVRSCLQRRLKSRLARGVPTTCDDWIKDHQICFQVEGYSNPCTNASTLALLCNNLFLPGAIAPGAIPCSQILEIGCSWPTPYPESGISPLGPPRAIKPRPHPCTDSFIPAPCLQTYT